MERSTADHDAVLYFGWPGGWVVEQNGFLAGSGDGFINGLSVDIIAEEALMCFGQFISRYMDIEIRDVNSAGPGMGWDVKGTHSYPLWSARGTFYY